MKRLFVLLPLLLTFYTFDASNTPYKLEIIFKEMPQSISPDDITSSNLKYVKSINEFKTEEFLWPLASLLYNKVSLSDVQHTGGKYCTLFGDIENEIKFPDTDYYLVVTYLDQKTIEAQVKWHESLKITNQESYQKHYDSLQDNVKERLETHPNFGKEIQYEKLAELFQFYKQANENGSWILIHQSF